MSVEEVFEVVGVGGGVVGVEEVGVGLVVLVEGDVVVGGEVV
ncbi:hypothetical protein [Mycobacterium liflandii]